jgi:hypothetical protein
MACSTLASCVEPSDHLWVSLLEEDLGQARIHHHGIERVNAMYQWDRSASICPVAK